MMGVGGIQVVARVVAPVGGGGAPDGVELMLEESLTVLLLSISEGSLDQSARVCSEMSERGDPIALNGVVRVGVSEEMFARQNSDEMGWEGSNYVLGSEESIGHGWDVTMVGLGSCGSSSLSRSIE